ncbi:MAG TPA: BON domain-containing protein [Phenylobacterium sp.]|uniref:BON domain-containing protein n=1 Tax=Phenylobacterium sp. TaxID=1871053 RepID=UPI002CAC6D1B|nr:BON domain-containing protein [Phenylobacterium sp.]HSV03129.1 BON domain-containing protein [Phenylobacterium sp.]
MADRWMDERDRRWRDRDWRRSEDYGRGEDERRFQGGEDRSFGASDDEDRRRYEARRAGPDRDRVFGERETGMGYGGEDWSQGRGAYGAGGRYGAGEGYRPGRSGAYRGEGERQGGRGGGSDWRSGGWQDRDFGGVSPAMEHDEYDLEHRAERYEREHGYGESGERGRSGRGGRYYGDAGREAIYREEWSQGRRDYGEAPRGYDAEEANRDRSRGSEAYSRRAPPVSGGTGGYDYERGYGDGGRRDEEGRYARERYDRRDEDRGERFERAGRESGDWFRRAGERVASWFGGDRRDEERGDRGRGYQGMGPKGYQRPDERINEEAHERLTDDPWLDASNISVSVSGGEVTLSGTVENREAKHRAERIVEDLSGVRHVQNNLRIHEGNPLTTPSRGYGDSVLEQQMREADMAGKTGPGPSDGGARSPTSSRTGPSASTDTGKSR